MTFIAELGLDISSYSCENHNAIGNNISSINTYKDLAMKSDSYFNPLTPMSDQDRISPYNINTISSTQVMRKKKISAKGSLVDPITNSLT